MPGSHLPQAVSTRQLIWGESETCSRAGPGLGVSQSFCCRGLWSRRGQKTVEEWDQETGQIGQPCWFPRCPWKIFYDDCYADPLFHGNGGETSSSSVILKKIEMATWTGS